MTDVTETVLTAPFAITNGPQRHARYAQLAAAGPIHRIVLPTGKPAWLVTGYDEVRQALSDPRLVKSEPARDVPQLKVFAVMNSHMLHRDPPDHTRLRRLVNAVFTRRRVEQLAPRIQQITDELLDAMATATQVDLIDAFAYPLPLRVICELLGVPAVHRAEIHEWSSLVVTGAQASPDTFAAAGAAIVGYLQELIEAKRATPTADLLSALVAVRDGEDQLSEDELTSMAFLLLVAGHETTLNLIGNGMFTLFTHPEQLALLRARPDQLSTAIEELLRFEGVAQVATLRWAAAPVEIGGITISAGEIVLAGLFAANRDPAFTAQPDTLNITRTDNPHLAFGHGVHHCLGASLARLEGRIALGTLLARFPRLRLAVPAEQLTWWPGVFVNGLTALPVTLH
jgi:cytochrome P450